MPRRSEKRDIILDAAEEIFSEKGFHLATVDEIAQKAGVAKGTIYLYFKDKLDLFLSTMERKLIEMVSKLEEVEAEVDDPVEAIAQIIALHFEFAKSHERLIQHMTPEKFKPPADRFHGNRMPLVREKIFRPINRSIELIERCIRRGQEKGVFKPDLDPRTSSLALSSMVRGIVFARIIIPQLMAANDESFEVIKTIFLDGIRR